MKKLNGMIVAALLAGTACSDADMRETEGMADTDTEMAHDAAVEVTEAAHAALLNPNTATSADLVAAGVPDAAAAAVVAGRPYDNMLAVDAALAGLLDEAGREAVYRVMWLPFDLNSVSREEILLVPGVGDRMAHEFEEYRPYEAMAEFHREIGKYVDDEEVERLAQYVMVASD